MSVTSPIIDVHCHLMTEGAGAPVAEHYSPDHILANEAYDLYAGTPSREHNRSLGPVLLQKLGGVESRLADMDQMGVDVQVLAPFVSQNYYWTDAGLGQQVARLQNERLAEVVDHHPSRFAAIGTVPLQDTATAIKELDHLMGQLEMKGVQISSNINGLDLDDPRFIPFWDRAQECGAVVVIHPSGFTEGRRLDDFFLTNLIGNPLDSTIALSRLIFSGRIAQFPDLRWVVAHGGGYTPFYTARLDHGWEVRPEARVNIDQPPSAYLKQVYFDTMVFSPRELSYLIDFAGPDHVLLGTDYPFDMGEQDPVALTGRIELSDEDRSRVRGGNAIEVFGLA